MVNAIPLASFDRKDYITRTQNYNRYKIVNYKRYFKRKPGVPRNGVAIFAYDKGDRLSIIKLNYNAYATPDGEASFNSSKSVILRMKVKDGHLVVWQCKNGPRGLMSNSLGVISKIRNISCRTPDVKKELFNFGVKNIYDGPFPNEACQTLMEHEEGEGDRIKPKAFPNLVKSVTREIKSTSRRLNKVLLHFLKRNNIKIKPSKDFFENLRNACYPNSASVKLAEQWLNPAFSRHFLHGDLDYVIEKCFGVKDQQLSDLVKARIDKDKSFDCLLIGCLLYKYVPLSYLYKALDANVERLAMASKTWSFKIPDCRRLLKRYSPDIILRLVLAEDFKDFHFSNTINLLHQFRNPGVEFPTDPKNWKELHDGLEAYRQKMVGLGLVP